MTLHDQIVRRLRKVVDDDAPRTHETGYTVEEVFTRTGGFDETLAAEIERWLVFAYALGEDDGSDQPPSKEQRIPEALTWAERLLKDPQLKHDDLLPPEDWKPS